jgi:GNAT superfamily N-acetyltransferase
MFAAKSSVLLCPICVMAKINIEIYSDLYRQSVPDLILNIQQHEFGIPITLEQQKDLKDIPAFYQVNNGNFWVAIDNGMVVGTIALLDIGNGRGALRKMFVKAEYRGKEYGTGQKLLNTLLEWARHKMFTEILLGTTEKFIAAHRFYEKNKFIQIEKESLPEEFPIMPVDVRFYQYLINKE